MGGVFIGLFCHNFRLGVIFATTVNTALALLKTHHFIYLQRQSKPGNGLLSLDNLLTFNKDIFNNITFFLRSCTVLSLDSVSPAYTAP